MSFSVDWQMPWNRSVREESKHIRQSNDWKATLNTRSELMQVITASMLPIRFVDQQVLPTEFSYEAFVYQTGQVPTRDNPHDFFNALVWLTFPTIKRQLNALQAAQINSLGIRPTRGRPRDAATLFDESAALIVVSDDSTGESLLKALHDHDWQTLFVDLRDQFHFHMDVWLFGHALMEKLMQPYKAITAHAWVVRAPDTYCDFSENRRRIWLDERIGDQLNELGAEGLLPRLFTPLPVLGIPGWWPEQNAEFYNDASVFRPRRNSLADALSKYPSK